MRHQPCSLGAGANDDCVVSGKVVDLRDRRSLIDLVVRIARDLVGYELGNAFDVEAAPPLLSSAAVPDRINRDPPVRAPSR